MARRCAEGWASRFSSPAIRASTQRLLTAEQLETIRDVALPDTMTLLAELRGRLIRFGEESAEHARIANEDLFERRECYKVSRGQEQALVDPALIAAKRKADADLRARRDEGQKARREIGDPWTDIAHGANRQKGALSRPIPMRRHVPACSPNLFGLRTRAGACRAKNAPSRIASACRNTPTAVSRFSRSACWTPTRLPDLEAVLLEFWLTKLREHLHGRRAGYQCFPRQGIAAKPSRRGCPQSKLADAGLSQAICGMAAWRRSVPATIR